MTLSASGARAQAKPPRPPHERLTNITALLTFLGCNQIRLARERLTRDWAASKAGPLSWRGTGVPARHRRGRPGLGARLPPPWRSRAPTDRAIFATRRSGIPLLGHPGRAGAHFTERQSADQSSSYVRRRRLLLQQPYVPRWGDLACLPRTRAHHEGRSGRPRTLFQRRGSGLLRA